MTSTGGTVSFTSAASTFSGGPSWLSASPPTAQTTAAVSVSVSQAGLAPGSYTGQVKFSPQNAGVNTAVVAGDAERGGAADVQLRAGKRPGDGRQRVFGDVHGGRGHGSVQLVDRGGSAAGWNRLERGGGDGHDQRDAHDGGQLQLRGPNSGRQQSEGDAILQRDDRSGGRDLGAARGI